MFASNQSIPGGPPGIQLAIETTGRSGSLAIVDSCNAETPRVQCHRCLPADQRTATSITKEIQSLVGDRSLDFIGVAVGPGSFTGLRIGVTTAKTLAFAWQIRLVAVDSLMAIAASAFLENSSPSVICVAVNAYRGQVFSGTFRRSTVFQSPPTTSTESLGITRVLSEQQWSQRLAELSHDDNETALSGDPACFEQLDQRTAPFMPRVNDAVGVALLAHHAAWRNEFIDPLALVPNYLRPSVAEEKARSQT